MKECWCEMFGHDAASYRFVAPISTGGHLRNEYPRREREIGSQLFDQLRVSGQDHFLVNLIRIACIDDLHAKFVARHEFIRGVNITAGVCLVDEPLVLLIATTFNNLTSGHDWLEQFAITINSEFQKFALKFHFGFPDLSKTEHRRDDPPGGTAFGRPTFGPDIKRYSIIQRGLRRAMPLVIRLLNFLLRIRTAVSASLLPIRSAPFLVHRRDLAD